MRVQAFFAVLMVGLLVSAPAMAGKVSYVDGVGKWVPSGCTAPAPMAAMDHNPEAKANALNARVAEHNQFVSVAEAYMNCVSQEAQRDAEAFGQLITSSAQGIINQTQSDISESATRAQAKSATE